MIIINNIKRDSLLLIDHKKEGRIHYYILENGNKLKAELFKKGIIEIKCNGNKSGI